MKKFIALSIFACSFLAMQALPQKLHATEKGSSEVQLKVTGSIAKYVTISTDTRGTRMDLEKAYDRFNGLLKETEFPLAKIDARSNSKDGYSISVSTANDFNLVNGEGVPIKYRLKFAGAKDLPDNGKLAEVVKNNGVILSVSGSNTFAANILEDGAFVMTVDEKKDFLFNGEAFSDSIKLSIVAK